MNTPLLRQIQKHIAEVPRRFIMGAWSLTNNAPGEVVQRHKHDFGLPEVVAPACGTVACIGGWAQLLTGRQSEPIQNILRLSYPQFHRLCFVSNWPKKLREKFARSRSVKNRVAIANERIDLFVKTRGSK